MMALKIASININGFRSKLKQNLIKSFVLKNKIDILLLQETFIDNITLANSIEQSFNLEKRCIWNFGKSNSCGVAICLFNEHIQIQSFHTDVFGRLIRLDFSTDAFPNFRIINAYFPVDTTERLDFLNDLSQYICGAKNLIIGGDFNFILDTKLDKIGGNLNKGTIGSKIFKPILEKMNLIDCFRYLYPNKRTVTWTRKNVAIQNKKSNYEMVGTRLDRFYMSSLIKDTITGFETLPCTCSDHDYIVLNLTSAKQDGITFGKSYWKFNDDLLNDENFVNGFKLFWAFISNSQTVTLDWWDKTKENIKLFCIDFSKCKNKQLYGKLKQLKKQYTSLDLNETSDLVTLNDIKEKVKYIEHQIYSGSIIRSKANIIDCNENPTSYFFHKETTLAKEKTVRQITSNNITYTNSEDILTCFKSFYENLYTEESADSSLNHHFLDNLPQVSSSDNLLLKQIIRKHEVLSALKSMQPNKSPGSDGLSSAFYLKFFDILGDTLTHIINLAYEQKSLSKSQKLSYITLICKDNSRSDDMKCYRPISLLNIDYKIISKILTSRLSRVLPKIINTDQTCAVKGRSIFDNLHLIRNVIDYIDQKNLPVSFICLDQEKAFDRVSWEYMYSTLAAFGFDENFINWIKLLYTDISSSVIVNNFISPSFPIERGVRQGCSLSQLLYVICFEPFAQKIRNLDVIKGLKLPGSNLELKMSIYADDSIGIFVNDTSMQHYFYWVKLFGKISGSKVNLGKSKGMFLGKWKNRSDHPFGISWVKSHKILGYLFGHDITPDDFWSKLVLKFDKTLNLWRSRQLSFKGKSTVLNSLCLSKLLYYSTANIIPSHYLTLLQRSSFRFIWNSTYEPLARNTLYLDFHEGGLNVPNMKLKCFSSYLTHIQNLVFNRDAKWTYFAKYWIGIHLRKLNPSLGSSNFPHSECPPPFYRTCLKAFDIFIKLYPDFSFYKSSSKIYYKIFLKDIINVPKICTLCPNVNFKSIWKNIYLPCIDPRVRNTIYKLCHDIMYVNYYLYNKNISKDKKCPLCGRIETTTHLFLECPLFRPLNKIVLFLLRRISNKINYSERIFRFFDLPSLENPDKFLALILLSESRHIIWTSRNLVKHEKENVNVHQIVSRFFSKIKIRILADKERLHFDDFVNIWLAYGFCKLDLTNNKIEFHPELSIDYYIKKKIISVS